MKYFKQNNEVFAYDDEQLAIGYGKDMTPMADEEIELHINPTKTPEQVLFEKVQEAKMYLLSTDFKMTLDYDKDTTEIKVLRAEAREFIRINDVPNP